MTSEADGAKVEGRLRILQHREVRRWYEKKIVRSRVTGDEYARKLSFILERVGLDPDSVVVEAKRNADRLEDRLVKYASEQKAKGRLDNYIRKSLNGLRSYLSFRHVAFDRWPELSPIQGASIESERVPRPEELEKILTHLSTRGRVVALMMAHAGVRPSVLGGYRGASGLTLGDLPDLRYDGRIEFTEVPFVIRVQAAQSKIKKAYTTFGTQQLGVAIVAELERRRQRGEELGPRSPLIAAHATRGVAATSRSNATSGGIFLGTKAVLDEVRDALASSVPTGVRWRAYVLRSYCSTRLLMAEGDGRITRDLAQEILGHNTGTAGRYHVGKMWGPELLAEARREYANASAFLETNGVAKTDGDRNTVKMLIEAVENSPEGKDTTLTRADLLAMLRRFDGGGSSAGSAAKAAIVQPVRAVQKLVPAGELKELLETGAWRYIDKVGDQVVVEPF